METIKFKNGKEHNYPTRENDIFKFYITGIASDAEELEAELKAQGLDAQKDFGSLGWFVRVRKIYRLTNGSYCPHNRKVVIGSDDCFFCPFHKGAGDGFIECDK